MKIALLTLPFVNNYGGILQAYALKHFLELRGHSVCIIDRNSNFKISFIDILRLAKRKFLGNRIRNFAYFKKQYLLPMTSEIITNKEMLLLDEKYQFDIYIVGSDQVWRAIYYRDIKYNFYLDFTGNVHHCDTLDLLCSLSQELPNFSFLGNYVEYDPNDEH